MSQIPKQLPTFRSLKELCAKHLPLEAGERRTTFHGTTCLHVDSKSRAARCLYDTCTQMHDALIILELETTKKIALLTQETSALKQCLFEWEHCFGSATGATPFSVKSELESLRQRVKDVEQENKNLKLEGKQHAQHVECIYNLSRKAQQALPISPLPVPRR